jgi:hypothetical protein
VLAGIGISSTNSSERTNRQQQRSRSTKHLSFNLKIIHPILCNENQSDSLFILNLLRHSTSTCFTDVYCSSSGGIRYIGTAIGTCYTFRLTGCWPGQDGTQSSILTRPAVKYQLLYIYSEYLLMMDNKHLRNM